MIELPTLPYGTPLVGQAASDWAVAILNALKAPVTVANIYSLAGWFLREGGGGQNNPMNTTLGSQYPAINSDGVRNFPTPDVGVDMTVQTLEAGYQAVIHSFQLGTGLANPGPEAQAELLKWSGGGYSSITPVVVPIPAPPKPVPSFHYERYDDTVIRLPFGHNSERNVVENYDRQRAHLARFVVSVGKIEINLRFLQRRLRNNMRTDPANNDRFDREFRLQGVSARRWGKRVKPS